MKVKVNQLKAGMILSYLQIFLKIAVQLLYTPLMIKLLGANEYGLYNTVSSTIAMLGMLNLGFNASYIRYYSKYKKDNDTDSISKLNGLFLVIFSVLGLISLACGLFMTFNLKLIFDTGLTFAEYKTAKWLMLLFTINLSLTFPASVFSSIISANEKFVLLKLATMVKTVLSPILSIPCLLLGYGSIGIVIVTVVISLVSDSILAFFVFVKLKFKFFFHDFEKGLFKSLFAFTFFIALNSTIELINSNLGKLLLGRFKGTEVVAIYSVGYTLYQFYLLFSYSISGVFTPKVYRIVNETSNNLSLQRESLTAIFTKVGRLQFVTLSLIASGIVFFGKPFINMWAGAQFSEAYYVTILIVIPASISMIQNLGYEIQRAKNKHRFWSIANAITMVINVIVTVIMCQKYNAIGAAIGTATSFVVAYGFLMNAYYHKACNIDIIKFWKSILRLSAGLVLPIISGIAINYLFNVYNLLYMVLGIILYSVIYAISMWLFGLNDYEKNQILSMVKKIFRTI